MSERIQISEIQIHRLKGEFPTVPTYPHVDTALLYQNDPNPFHITLPIAEVGRVSDNGLLYDEETVSSIAEQMQQGLGGIRGHIPSDAVNSAFPVDEVHWIGHMRVGEFLWAKGYIPPGATRDDTQRKIARGGSIGTSIWGLAIRETITGGKKKTWRAQQLQIENIDLAPAKRAALRMGRGVQITKEMSEEGDMPEKEIVTAADVPAAIREQIIRESDLASKAERVAEMEKVNSDLTTQVAELATYKSIVAEIRTTLGANADIPVLVAEYYNAVSKLTTMLGVQDVASISVRVEEMQTVVAEFKQNQFNAAVDTKIAELTDWTPRTDEGKKKVAAFRSNLRRAVLAEMGGTQETEKISETADKLWDAEFQTIAETIVAALGGPGALVGAKQPTVAAGVSVSDEQLGEWAGRYNQTARKQ